MSRYLLLIICFLFFTGKNSSIAQFANSWIHYDQKYVKLGVKKKGIYRVSFEILSRNGLSISNETTPYIQVFHKGKEIPVLEIQNNQLLFLGEPNDGSSDSLLYRPHSARMNPYYSLFSDEGFYFITIGKTIGKRIKTIESNFTKDSQKLTWHMAEELQVFSEEYSHTTAEINIPVQSFLKNQETFTGKSKKGNDTYNINFNLTNLAINSEVKPNISLMVNGRTANSNKVEVSIDNQPLTTIDLLGFRGSEFTTDFTSSIKDNKVSVSFKSIGNNSGYSLTYLKLKYPQNLIDASDNQSILNLVSSNLAWQKVELNSNSNYDYLVFDISEPDEVKIIPIEKNNNKIVFEFKPSSYLSNILVTPTISLHEVSSITKANFTKVDPSQVNFLMITNSHLKNAVEDYKDYRESLTGGQHKVHLADISDVYNEFNYGEPSPIAIRNFTKYFISDRNWKKNLLLIGSSISMPIRIKKGLIGTVDDNPKYTTYWQIPTIGYPGSDMLLVDGLDSLNRENVPGVPIGRIPAMDPEEVIDYLNKLKEYESSLDFSWKKNILHISGGKSESEIVSFQHVLNQFKPLIQNSLLGGDVTALVKPNLNPTVNVDISSQVNNGVGMISYFGHGSTVITDYNFGYASPPEKQFSNRGKYPFMYFNGCGVGNIFSGRYSSDISSFWGKTISTDWLVAQNKGAIAILANSFDSYTSTSTRFLQVFYKLLYENGDKLSIGEIIKSTAYNITSGYTSEFDIANLNQSLLQGDPTIKIFDINLPDYSPNEKKNVSISAIDAPTIENSKELLMSFSINNLGRFIQNQSIPISITLKHSDNTESKKEILVSSISYSDSIAIVFTNNSSLLSIRIEIDPSNTISELNKTNNTYVSTIDWEGVKKLHSFIPEVYIDMIAPILTVKVDNKFIEHNSTLKSTNTLSITLQDNQELYPRHESIEVFLKRSDQLYFEKVDIALSSLIVDGNTLNINIPLNSLNSGDYQIVITGRDREGNVSLPYQSDFVIKNENSQTSIVTNVSPNPATTFVKFDYQSPYDSQIYKVAYIIYDVLGSIVYQKEELVENRIPREHYWIPKKSGLYIYRVEYYSSTNEPIKHTGKIIVNR